MASKTRTLVVVGALIIIWIFVIIYAVRDMGDETEFAGKPTTADAQTKQQLLQRISEIENENRLLIDAGRLLLDDRQRLEDAVYKLTEGQSGKVEITLHQPVAPRSETPVTKCPDPPATRNNEGEQRILPISDRPGVITMGDHAPRTGPRHRVLSRMPVVTEDLVNRAKSQLVLVWGSHFFGDITGETKCPVKCMWTSDASQLDKADAVWFHIPTFSGFPPSKPSGQKWVAMSMEGDGYYPKLKDAEFMSQFDLTMTYRLDSDVPTPYASWSEYNFMEPPIKKTDEALAVFVASNCGPKNRRNEWVQELMKLIPVHSYGKCFNNKEFPSGGSSNWFQKKIDVLRPYKFYLAFDNTDSGDYVSEKFFHGLVAGTVPVYMGAPNIEDFEPSPHSVIKVDDFKSPAELAEFLKMVGSNEGLYKEYLQWKKDGVSQKFRDLVNLNDIHSRCRLCIRLAQDQLGLDNESRPK